MSVLVGLDVGTGGARAVAVDNSGEIVAEASSEYPLHTPRPGWTEQDPEDWWEGAKEVLAKVASEAGEVAGIGLTGQMHGSVFLDGSDRVVRPALLWNDQRTQAQCDGITHAVGAERLISISGNPALTGFQAPKIVWLRDEEPENYGRVSRVLLPKDYVRLRLTGEYATDASDAAGTLLLDMRARDWSGEILDALEIPHEWMPEVYEGPENTGALRESVAEELGLVPEHSRCRWRWRQRRGGGRDRHRRPRPRQLLRGHERRPLRPHRRVQARPFRDGCTRSATPFLAPTTSWASRSRRAGRSPGGARRSAATSTSWSGRPRDVPPGSEGLVFLPYLSGERTPHLDPKARGAFFGLTARHGVAHMTRAVMEGVIFSLRDSLEIMRDLDVPIEDVRATGGGARSDLWRQLQADIYATPIRRTVADEGPAYGAALLAGVASGTYADVDEATSVVKLREEITEPDPERSKIYEEYYEVYRSLYPATRSAMSRSTDLAAGSIGQ